MIMMLMESNPQLAPALGRGFAAFSQEIERLEKSKELEVLITFVSFLKVKNKPLLNNNMF